MIGLLEQQQSVSPSHHHHHATQNSHSPISQSSNNSNFGAGSFTSLLSSGSSGGGGGVSPSRGLQRDVLCSPRVIIGFFAVCVIALLGLGASSALSADPSGALGGLWHSRSSDPRHDNSHRVLAHPEKHEAAALEAKLPPLTHHHDADGQQPQHSSVVVNNRNNNSSSTESSSSSSSHTPWKLANNKTLYTDWYVVQGRIRMRMRPDAAPLSVANIFRLIREGKYTKSGCFYRCECDPHRPFVLQAGMCSKSDHKTVPLEYKLPNKKWTVALARRGGDHNSGGTEWFINLSGNSAGLGPQHKGGYCVFAEVVEGFDVIKKLMKLPTHNSAGVNKKTGKRKKGGLMLFSKPVPHFLNVTIIEE